MGFVLSISKVVSIFVFGFWLLNMGTHAKRLVEEEVGVLKEIAKTIGKSNWNFSVDPCSGEGGWVTANASNGFENNVSCDCNNDTICHVVSIVLKAQNLSGVLPSEIIRLPSLQQIDFSRNYLNGTIPPEWGSTKLVNISLLGNRLTGSIPTEIANISTLTSLVLEYNHLSGSLPPELGNLPLIERLFVTSNNFTGELPATLAKLTTLKDFRIGDNHFTGKIPNFIQNWPKLEKLVIQASGLDGPIPSGITLLENLTDLRISDLNGTEAPFPPLNNRTKRKTLILRGCNLIGQLPDYLGDVTKLKILDLSFNKLSGEIPKNYSQLSDVDYIYLTGNLLTGAVPDWILNKGQNIDLSYNNFTNVNMDTCQQRTVNLFGSSSNINNSYIISGIVKCLNSFPCSQEYDHLHINCGGQEVTANKKTKYEADMGIAKPAQYIRGRTNWAFSSTGHFLDDDIPDDEYILKTTSSLSVNNPELYMTARLSPISLTYYAFCMKNGSYTVNLHFAEIMFTDDKTYSSLGRRIFDVYIQGKLVLKDFNIEDEAGGVRKAIIKKFTAIVTSSTLEIRFYWAGRGTDAIPSKGVYGPLISAISVDPDFSSGISVGTLVIIVAAAAAAFITILFLGILRWKVHLRRKNTASVNGLKGLDLQTASFTLRQIIAATNNFDNANKIGEGGFGSVYKGLLSDGTVIAVKQLSSKSKQGNREFVNELGMISALQHPHLVKLYGCCIDGNQLLLVYEYMENNSLARALFGSEEYQLKLDWPTRQNICIGIARGLAYLHEESRLKIVHRDIKATNVLLDKDLNPKISDFGLAKLDEPDNTHISTRIAGTYGYMAPEYAMRGYLTDKADVYSFGIVALEIVSGRCNTTYRSKDDCFYLLDWALVLKENGNLMDLVDPRLGEDYNKEEVMAMINVALLCTNTSYTARPSMSSVVSMLEGRAGVQDFVLDSSVSTGDMNSKAMKKHNQQVEELNINECHTESMEVPFTASSTSAPDLYPVNLDSDYWKNRD